MKLRFHIKFKSNGICDCSGVHFITCACGIFQAIFNWMAVRKVEIFHKHEGLTELLQGAELEKIETLLQIGEHIQEGAQAFLREEYTDCSVFLAIIVVLERIDGCITMPNDCSLLNQDQCIEKLL